MRPWTTAELKVLRLFATLGRDGVAALLDRSPTSVAAIAREHGISLKATGEDIAVNAEIIGLLERVRETPYLAVCPMCGKRWATMRDTGVCRPCHLDRLISLAQERLEVETRQRALTSLRKEKQRRLGELE